MNADEVAALFDLRGRVAIVTGGTRGIGRAIAEGLAAAGASVVVASRKPEACAKAEEEIAATGAAALGVATHMGDLESVSALVAATVSRFGRIDIIVNNAAAVIHQPIASMTPEAWEKMHDVNLRGPVFLCQEALPHLRETGNGSVLHVISTGALMFAPGQAMYAGAKAAMLAYTRNMAAEWAADGIRVNALAPGTVDTDLLRSSSDEAIERMKTVSWQRRIAAPMEMVGPALFLVSDAASYVTGQVIVADGGLVPAR